MMCGPSLPDWKRWSSSRRPMAKRLLTVGDLVLDLLLEVQLPLQADAHQMSPSTPAGAGRCLHHLAGGAKSRS